MKSLKVRIFVSIASVILVFAAAVMVLNWTCLSGFYISHGNRLLKSAAGKLASLMPEQMSYDTDAFMALEEGDGVEIILYKENGEAVYATALRDFHPERDDPDWMRFRLREALGAEILRQEYDSNESRYEVQRGRDGTSTYLAYRAHIKDDTWAVVRVNAEMLRDSASVANTFMLITVAMMLIVAVLASAIIAGHLSKPVRQMNGITRAMSNFDFSHKVTVTGKDEIAQLAMSINTLSDNTSRLLDELSEKNARLEQEVEHERALDKMRKEFISNVSHELKTPIAIIQGYAEGLRLNVAGDAERRAMYCDIIESESYKMDRLVKQLLELSRLESGAAPLTVGAFNLTDLVTETVGRIRSITDDIRFECAFDGSPRVANGDEMRLQQVLTNYMNNAVSHCRGDMLVKVDIKDTDVGWRVSVFNSGDPIPEEELESIWMSFYRVDKSRSRENGNAGLGLSIVSNIMKQHGMDYGVENVPGGVNFWFDVGKMQE